ncbi:MAG: hypothetical protein QOD91_490 [Frankiales bacterium]|nr:hypothetical protein [Frankiales bacterium]
MLFDLRVTVPDRPGALARLAALVADHGIDVRGIEVLGSSDDGVIDHLLLECEPGDAHGLTAALSTEAGFVVLGLRRSSRTRGSAAELDFLLALADNIHLGVDLFTDAIPRIFAADWAIAYRIQPREVSAQTALAPSVDWDGRVPRRAVRVTETSGFTLPTGMGAEMVTVVLADSYVMLLGRQGGPPFHDAEVLRLRQLSQVCGAIMATKSADAAVG